MLRLKDVEYLYKWQWHWELDEYDDNDIKKRFKMHNIYKYRWDIHSVYNRATESNHNDKYNKYSENDKIKALNSEHIHR